VAPLASTVGAHVHSDEAQPGSDVIDASHDENVGVREVTAERHNRSQAQAGGGGIGGDDPGEQRCRNQQRTGRQPSESRSGPPAAVSHPITFVRAESVARTRKGGRAALRGATTLPTGSPHHALVATGCIWPIVTIPAFQTMSHDRCAPAAANVFHPAVNVGDEGGAPVGTDRSPWGGTP
jgi:hypothetical protein